MKMDKNQWRSFLNDILLLVMAMILCDWTMDALHWEGFWKHLLCMLIIYIPLHAIYEWLTTYLARKQARRELDEEGK